MVKPASDIGALFKRIAENDDQDAFKTLFYQYYDVLCNYAFRFLQNKNSAEEAVSEVFVKIWMKRKEIPEIKSHQSFLYTSVRNQSIDFLRKQSNKQNFVQFDIDLMATNNSPQEEMEYNELAAMIEKGIQKLPPQCRTIFLMSREEQMSYQEIADKLGISLKTVKTQMYRAVKKTRNFLKDKNVNIILFFFF
ncbi:RNA polymerase sigma-70 factor [Mariniphaga sediminis]|uniref:RNA polymerase sigma-70 factor n=1 Tax=Mariniphaga sediminis TaxID=1628158 RepID=UPI0035667A64